MEQKDSTPQRQLEDEFLAGNGLQLVLLNSIIFYSFLALADYSPTIPEELTEYCLKRSGFQTSDQKMYFFSLTLATRRELVPKFLNVKDFIVNQISLVI